MNTVKFIDLKEHSSDAVSLLIQVVLIEFMIIFGIITLIESRFITVLYVILSLIMFTMAYNNHKYFHKKYMNIIYIAIGIYILLSTVIGII